MRISAASLPEILLAVVVSIAATAVLLASAVFSSLRPKQLAADLRALSERTGVPLVEGRLILGLIPLGVISGLPIALGLLRTNAFVLISALGACMIGRGLLAADRPMFSIAGPFLAVAWSVLAGVQRFETFDLGAAMSAQSMFGPVAGFGENPSSWAALPIGLWAAALWSASLPSLSGFSGAESIDRLLRIGERALAAAAISATLWGPSLGALVRGPLDLESLGWIGLSFGATTAAVVAVTLIIKVTPRNVVVGWSLAGGALLILLAGELLR